MLGCSIGCFPVPYQPVQQSIVSTVPYSVARQRTIEVFRQVPLVVITAPANANICSNGINFLNGITRFHWVMKTREQVGTRAEIKKAAAAKIGKPLNCTTLNLAQVDFSSSSLFPITETIVSDLFLHELSLI